MKSILIIEDDQAIARALAIRMRSAGYKAVMAYDALGGVRMAKHHEPDLVLLDINMPGGDGFLVAERIIMTVPSVTPIIFLTASREPGFRDKARELGAAGYFEKPYEAHDLLNTIQETIGV